MNTRSAARYLNVSQSTMRILGREGLGKQKIEGDEWHFDLQDLIAVKKLQQVFSSSTIAAARYHLLQEMIYQLQSQTSTQMDDVELEFLQKQTWRWIKQLSNTPFGGRVLELCHRASAGRSQILQLVA